MFEILLLVIGTGAIASFARGRGASPKVWGTIAAAGYILIEFFTPLAMRALGWKEQILPLLFALAWFAGTALYVRFGIGAGRPSPDSQWTCKECNYMNGRHAIFCEACGKLWQ